MGEGRLTRRVYGAAVVACGLLSLVHGVALAEAVIRSGVGVSGILGVAGGALLGVVAADFVTGAVHWACDSYGSERTPLVGTGLIRGFREHHRRPQAMLASDVLDANGQSAAAVALALALLALPGLQTFARDHPAAYAFALALCAVSALGNQLHQWAHTGAAPQLVRGLQRRGWILSPRAHARHHRPPHVSAYCTATGWCNAPLDAAGFWRALERGVERATGVRPRAASPGAPRFSR